MYQDVVLNVDFNDPETNENVKLAVKGSTQYNNINAKQEFKIGIPKMLMSSRWSNLRNP